MQREQGVKSIPNQMHFNNLPRLPELDGPSSFFGNDTNNLNFNKNSNSINSTNNMRSNSNAVKNFGRIDLCNMDSITNTSNTNDVYAQFGRVNKSNVKEQIRNQFFKLDEIAKNELLTLYEIENRCLNKTDIAFYGFNEDDDTLGILQHFIDIHLAVKSKTKGFNTVKPQNTHFEANDNYNKHNYNFNNNNNNNSNSNFSVTGTQNVVCAANHLQSVKTRIGSDVNSDIPFLETIKLEHDFGGTQSQSHSNGSMTNQVASNFVSGIASASSIKVSNVKVNDSYKTSITTRARSILGVNEINNIQNNNVKLTTKLENKNININCNKNDLNELETNTFTYNTRSQSKTTKEDNNINTSSPVPASKKKDNGNTETRKNTRRRRNSGIAGQLRLKCPKCGIQCSGSKDLIKHIQKHQQCDVIPFACDECGKLFIDKSSIPRHKQFVHQVGNKYKCEKCGKMSLTQQNYLSHLSFHRLHEKKDSTLSNFETQTKEKKRNRSDRKITKNINVTNGERETQPILLYVCDAHGCKHQPFRSKGALTRHKKTH